MLIKQCFGSKYIKFLQFGSGSRVMLSILRRKKIKIILEKTIFLKKYLFLNYKKIMVSEELFGQLSL